MRRPSQSFNVLAVVLILLGLILILDNFNIIPGVMDFWPILSFIIGLGFCLLFYRNKKKDLVLLGLGSFITLISIFFFYLNFTSWSKLLYMWPVFIIVLGICFLPPFAISRNLVLIVLAVLLMGAGASFILIFSISTDLWPTSLVLAGISFLIIGYFTKRRRSKKR